MAIYSRSPVQNFNNQWFWIKKNKCICLYAKDLSGPKYEFLIKKREDVGIKHLNDPSAFIKGSNTSMKILIIRTQIEKEKL